MQLDQYPRDSAGVVAIVCDNFTAKMLPIPRAHIAILGKHAKALLEDGFEWETVVVAAAIALRRGQPQFLQYIASDVVMAKAGERMSRRQYEQMLQDEMELKR
jgi:hypothetical protein